MENRQLDQEKIRNLMEIYKKHLERELGAKLEPQPAQPTTYKVSNFRYIIEAGPAVVGRVVPLDSALTDELCRDKDGCKIILQMINWQATLPGNVGSRTKILFISETSRWWRLSNDVDNLDNDGTPNDWVVWDCRLTDGEFYTGIANGHDDNAVGFGLLNMAGGQLDTITICRIVFED